MDRILTGGWAKGAAALEDATRRAPGAVVLGIDMLNSMAYRLMSAGATGDAMSMLQWAAARYPESANIQDSLGEISEKFGNPWISRPATERALKLLPDDRSIAEARRERILKGATERLQRLPPARTGPQGPRIETHGGLPAVSPDGSRIAFVSSRGGANNLYLVPADGGAEAQLTDSADPKGPPAWDREGHLLLSTRTDGQARIYTMKPDGKGRQQVAAVSAQGAVLSPDGKSVVYGNQRLFVAAADGTHGRPITTGVAMEFGAEWSPDGKQIAFVRSGPDRKLNVWVMNADGTDQRQLTHIAPEEGQAEWPRWSPDGKQIAIQVGAYSPGKSVAHLWIVEVRTGEAHKVAPHAEPYLDETPSWFPDGKRLAFQSDRTGRMEIWVMGADGSGARQVTK
jgi:Tol biopolymer transport system component